MGLLLPPIFQNDFCSSSGSHQIIYVTRFWVYDSLRHLNHEDCKNYDRISEALNLYVQLLNTCPIRNAILGLHCPKNRWTFGNFQQRSHVTFGLYGGYGVVLLKTAGALIIGQLVKAIISSRKPFQLLDSSMGNNYGCDRIGRMVHIAMHSVRFTPQAILTQMSVGGKEVGFGSSPAPHKRNNNSQGGVLSVVSQVIFGSCVCSLICCKYCPRRK
ncbi:protein kinase family protein [Corchorus olitorius]|uniref:Protein kinase family protein n=1 Tax=Corchorus olitorius TaxID=93759 RepID=A0A1R3IAR0_9ROSI|nr:protein kinase family protein [Corchorus olitorius]